MSADIPVNRLPDVPDPIAVVGIGCRFPGASNLSEFWRVLSKGENHIVTVPPDRWVDKDFFSEDPDDCEKSYINKAGFIKGFADFDHKLFGISETEALQMDPQQRQVLECTYMALENAGITRQQISGQKIGVYIGAMNDDFNMLTVHHSESLDQYSVAGQARSIIANRVSYLFNLTGPSMSIDTACSSSLVAIHQAILGLRAGDCSLTICGGVSLILHPQIFSTLCRARMLSPTGQCHTFSNNADGYTRGEGCGIVILKPLKTALSDGDFIWGTISTGLNQDGHFEQPITAPSQKQQETLLKDVFTNHNINPASVQYIEAHGTGTKRGDPTEVSAFASFFTNYSPARQRLIGSVKTNIGHLEPAAGVAGLIKVLLMMKHDVIVPSLNFDKPNELIDFDANHFVVPTSLTPWRDDVKVACLNSFGFGGANSHAVVQSIPGAQREHSIEVGRSHIVCFSGSTSKSLHDSMSDFLTHCDDDDIRSLSSTSTIHREHFKFRKAFVAVTVESLKKQIQENMDRTGQDSFKNTAKCDVEFVFCGMGTAWKGMCKDLIGSNESFRRNLQCIEKSLNRFVSWSLVSRFEESYPPNDPMFGPIAIFACQVALAQLWRSWGITPSAVVGQSVGEVAAAHIAGILSLDEAVKVIYHRTSIMCEASGGKMILVRHVDTGEIEHLCEPYKGKVNIALYYSPVACTISGDCEAVDALKSDIENLGKPDVQFIDLNLDKAFHSHHMDSCQQKLDDALCDLKTEHGDIEMISSVNSSWRNKDIMSSKYWGINVRQPVRFNDAIKCATNDEQKILLEIGPKAVLKAHLNDIFLDGVKPKALAEKSVANEKLLDSLAFLYESKWNIKWENVMKRCPALCQYPRYLFDHKRLWRFGPLNTQALTKQSGNNNHLFLTKSESYGEFQITISPSEFSTVFEHKVNGIIVVPGTTYAETGFGIIKVMDLGNPYTCSVSVNFKSPVTLRHGHLTDLSVDVSKTGSYKTTYTISKENTVHAVGKIVESDQLQMEKRIDIELIQKRCSEPVSRKEVYQMLGQCGFSYGESFATVSLAFRGHGESLAKLVLSTQLQEEMKHTLFHPAVLDGMLQAATVANFESGEFLPTELLDVSLHLPLQKEMIVYSKLTKKSGLRTSYFLCLMKSDGTKLATVRKFSIKFIGHGNFDEKSSTYKKKWSSIDFIPALEMNQTAVITNLDLNSLNMPWTLIDPSRISTEDHQLLMSRQGFDGICMIFEMSVVSLTGRDVVKELMNRLRPLRLLILHHVKQNLKIPLNVIMESRDTSDCFGKETANSCLNEATNGFCRCVLREFKGLKLKTVEVYSVSKMDFISKIPMAITLLSSSAMKDMMDVKLEDDKAYVFTVESDTRETPVYRTSTLEDGAVLSSSLPNSVVDPTFILADAVLQVKKKTENITEFLVTAAVTHKPSLFWVTSHFQQFGSSEASTYPILSLEFIGKKMIKSHFEDALVCFPSAIKKRIFVPSDCTLLKKDFPSYQLGSLLKLYTLWCMCNILDVKSVAILHSQETKQIAEALRLLFQSSHTKDVELMAPNDLRTKPLPATLILTVQLSSNLIDELVENSGRPLQIVSIGNIVNQATLCSLSSVEWIKVHILHPGEMFSATHMKMMVPKMFKWIKSHSKEVESLMPLLEKSQTTFRTRCSDVNCPIKLTEVLQMETLLIDNKDDFQKMRTPQRHLIKKSQTYLVIGGLTGLGWECVQYLAEEGAGAVIIMSRSKPNDSKHKDMRQLGQDNNCVIQFEQGDVTNFENFQKSFTKICSECSALPLGGIIYSAAVLRDSSLVEMTEEELESSLLPKVCGTWNVHILTANLALDIFLFHSSIASVFGNAGQSNYGSGNGFMDALANCRQKCNLSGQSINWGPIGVGMLENNAGVVRKLQNLGYNLIEKVDISQCLTHVLMLNDPESMISQMDFRKMAEYLLKNNETELLVRMNSFLKPFIKGAEKSSTRQKLQLEEIKNLETKEAIQMLTAYVKELVCETAMVDEDAFDIDKELESQGVDSMYAMTINEEIMSQCGVKFSIKEIQLQSAASVAKLISDRLGHSKDLAPTVSDNQVLVSKHTILRSIAESFFGFDTECEFDMSFVSICTVKVPELADSSDVKHVLRTCLSNHRLARSSCTLTNSSFSMKYLAVDEAFDFSELSGKDELEVDKRKQEPIRLESHGPLRFIFLKDTKRLVIVFHKFLFDMIAVSVFVQDIRKEVDRMLNKSSSQSGNTQAVIDLDIVEEIHNVLLPEMQELAAFWTSRIVEVPRSTFHFQDLDETPDGNHVLIKETFTEKLYNDIMEFTRSNDMTVFEYLISIYQLLQTLLNNSSKSMVTTCVDLRAYVPKLMHSLGRCTNLLPLICKVEDENMTVKDFLKDNKQNINSFIQHGLFPNEEVKRMAGDVGSSNLNRNFFIFEDDMMTNDKNELRVEQNVRFSSSTETILFMWQKRETQTLEIMFHLNGSLFSKLSGMRILKTYINLLEETLNNPGLTFRNLHQK